MLSKYPYLRDALADLLAYLSIVAPTGVMVLILFWGLNDTSNEWLVLLFLYLLFYSTSLVVGLLTWVVPELGYGMRAIVKQAWKIRSPRYYPSVERPEPPYKIRDSNKEIENAARKSKYWLKLHAVWSLFVFIFGLGVLVLSESSSAIPLPNTNEPEIQAMISFGEFLLSLSLGIPIFGSDFSLPTFEVATALLLIISGIPAAIGTKNLTFWLKRIFNIFFHMPGVFLQSEWRSDRYVSGLQVKFRIGIVLFGVLSFLSTCALIVFTTNFSFV